MSDQHSAPRRFDHLWSGKELAACRLGCEAFIARFGKQPTGWTNPWPPNPEEVAKAAFMAGWIAAKENDD